MLTLIESGFLSGLVTKAELRELLDELYDDFDVLPDYRNLRTY